MTTPKDVREYYERLRSIPIGDIVHEELADRITAEDSATIYVDCPVHASASRRSLHVYKHENRFRCWSCSVGGDQIHLLEFIRTGRVTQKTSGKMPESHREARDALAARIGLEPLGRGMEDSAEASTYRSERAVFEALTDAAHFFHEQLMQRADVVAWCEKQWGFGPEVLRRHLIGYTPAKGQWAALIATGNEPAAIGGTGLFAFDGDDRPVPFFRDRIFFPYFSRGSAVYGIGRRTPWTANTPYESPKYRKMRVHHEVHAAFVSRAINNRVLWGEDILATRPRRLLLTEGVTDAVAAQENGYACISPVTVRLSSKDIERTVEECEAAGVDTVCILQDNELSEVGERAAMEVAAALEARGIRCLVGSIPLTEDQRAARAAHAELLGEEAVRRIAAAEPNQRAKLTEEALGGDPERVAKARALAEESKADLCSYFRDGGTREGLDAVLDAARAPIEFAVDSVEIVPGDQGETIRRASEVLRQIGLLRPATQEAALRRLKERTGIGITVLRREAKAAGRVASEERKAQETRAAAKEAQRLLEGAGKDGDDQDESEGFRGIVEAERRAAALEKRPPDWGSIAEAVYRWLEAAGGRFYRGASGNPLLLWQGDLFDMRADASGPRSLYEGLLWRLGSVSPTTAGERRLFAVLSALSSDRGELYHPLPWIHTDSEAHVVTVLQGYNGNALRISPAGVTVVENGFEGLILRGDRKYQEWDYIEPDSDAYGEGGESEGWLDAQLHELLSDNFACAPSVGRFIIDWICCAFLLGFAGTRPTLRIEGGPSSGKSFVLKLATCLLYGHEAQKHGTNASNWSDASRNPFCGLDNLETVNATTELQQFLLLCVTKAFREKRAAGTESENITEEPNCLIATTGVEPLGGHLSEVMSRSLIVRFDRQKHASPRPVIESTVTGRILARRDLLLSAMARRVSKVLDLIHNRNAHERAMVAIRASTDLEEERRRLDEYQGLMWLWRVTGMPAEDRDAAIDALSEDFALAVRMANTEARVTSVDSSPITSGIEALFGLLAHDDEFRQESGLRFTKHLPDNPRISIVEAVTSTRLYTAVREAAKRRGIACPYENAVQFGRRLSIHIPLLEERGYSLRQRTIRGAKAWDIQLEAPSDDDHVADFEEIQEMTRGDAGGASAVQF